MKILQTLPNHWYRAICSEWYKGDKTAFASVTGLLSPIKCTVLEKRHWDELVVIDRDLIWSTGGAAFHIFLSRGASNNSLSEERLSMIIDGKKITGGFDHYEDELLSDNKETSAWQVIYKSHLHDWTMQLNAYRVFLEAAGFTVKSMHNYIKIKDWSYSKARYDKSYPQSNFVDITIERIDPMPYLKERIKLLSETLDMKDDDIPICTEHERYNKTTFAIMKPSNKNATHVYNTYEEASMKLRTMKPGYIIDKREGEDKRCMRYCIAKSFCNYAKERGYV